MMMESMLCVPFAVTSVQHVLRPLPNVLPVHQGRIEPLTWLITSVPAQMVIMTRGFQFVLLVVKHA